MRRNATGLAVGLLAWAAVAFVVFCAASLLLGCAALRPTPAERAVRRAATRLELCLAGSNGWPEYVSACHTAAAARCALAGLSDDCATAELWWRCVDGRIGAKACAPPTVPVDTRTRL